MSILELKRLLKRIQVLGVEDCGQGGTVDGAIGLHRIFTHVAGVWHLLGQHNDIQTHKIKCLLKYYFVVLYSNNCNSMGKTTHKTCKITHFHPYNKNFTP